MTDITSSQLEYIINLQKYLKRYIKVQLRNGHLNTFEENFINRLLCKLNNEIKTMSYERIILK